MPFTIAWNAETIPCATAFIARLMRWKLDLQQDEPSAIAAAIPITISVMGFGARPR